MVTTSTTEVDEAPRCVTCRDRYDRMQEIEDGDIEEDAWEDPAN